jgi:hypothetical protein
MASTFSPVQLSDDPRSWKAEIGLLNPDTHAVAFGSINDLVRWLKTLSVDVDSNLTRQFKTFEKAVVATQHPCECTETIGHELRCFVVTELRALPKYAQLGKMQASTAANAAPAGPEGDQHLLQLIQPVLTSVLFKLSMRNLSNKRDLKSR